MTIAQLIHHTSGIPDYIEPLLGAGLGLTDRTTQAQAVETLVDPPDPHAQPGGPFEHSDSNYLLLAETVRSVSGEPCPSSCSRTSSDRSTSA